MPASYETRIKSLTGHSDWYTPREYLDAAVTVMGAIDLDPASSQEAQRHVRASAFFTPEDDGLALPWHGRVFLNPPYDAASVRAFTGKLLAEYAAGNVKEAVLLVNNATDTEWFHSALAACSSVCFTRGRIKFLKAEYGTVTMRKNPMCGQVFFYFGSHAAAFAREFASSGTVLSRRKP